MGSNERFFFLYFSCSTTDGNRIPQPNLVSKYIPTYNILYFVQTVTTRVESTLIFYYDIINSTSINLSNYNNVPPNDQSFDRNSYIHISQLTLNLFMQKQETEQKTTIIERIKCHTYNICIHLVGDSGKCAHQFQNSNEG